MLMVWFGWEYIWMDERRIGGMEGWKKGRGGLPKGLIKSRQDEGNKKKGTIKGGHCLPSLFFSPRPA